MPNAISNALYNIYRKTRDNYNNQTTPQARCPRCGTTNNITPTSNPQIGIFSCKVCHYRQAIRNV